jgi:rubrerythrin
MEGGIRAWEGAVAEGFPESFMVSFASANTASELIAIAWLLEDGARVFYEEAASALGSSDGAAVFRGIGKAEKHHEEVLSRLHIVLAGVELDKLSIKSADQDAGRLMEGGVLLEDALSWLRGKGLKEIAEFAMGFETNAYDRYLYMKRNVSDDQARRVFQELALEEKAHIERMTAIFEKLI